MSQTATAGAGGWTTTQKEHRVAQDSGDHADWDLTAVNRQSFVILACSAKFLGQTNVFCSLSSCQSPVSLPVCELTYWVDIVVGSKIEI